MDRLPICGIYGAYFNIKNSLISFLNIGQMKYSSSVKSISMQYIWYYVNCYYFY